MKAEYKDNANYLIENALNNERVARLRVKLAVLSGYQQRWHKGLGE